MNSDKRRIGSLALIIVGFELIVIIGLIIGVVGRVRENNEIKRNEEALYDLEITNFRQVFKTIGKNSMRDIVFSVHDIVWLNTNNISKKVEAVIQEESVVETYYGNDNVYEISFVVDVPSLNQSYNVLHYYSDSDSLHNEKIPTGYRTIAFCPEDSTNCKDRYGGKLELILDKMEYK